MRFEIDHWSFSLTDARRSLAGVPTMIEHWQHGREPGVLDSFAGALRATVDGVDAHRGDPSSLAAPLARYWSALLGARAELAGVLPPTSRGQVVGLHRSDGGVPKTPVDSVEVDHRGVVGDAQAARQHHGRPYQALCLWSREVIDFLVAEGHRLAPGAAGENVLVSGWDWSQIRPGVRLRLGGVLAEVSCYALPCSKNAQWFNDGDHTRMHHERGPVSRVYATVLEPGSISVGDPAVCEPDA